MEKIRARASAQSRLRKGGKEKGWERDLLARLVLGSIILLVVFF